MPSTPPPPPQISIHDVRSVERVEGDGGRRFDVAVLTGRVLQVLCKTPEEAAKWVEAVRRIAKRDMAAYVVQGFFRTISARFKMRKARLTLQVPAAPPPPRCVRACVRLTHMSECAWRSA